MAMYGCVGLCRAVYGCVGLCMAMYGYLRLCRAMLGCIYTLLLVTIVKPLYDAYTTYLPDFLSLRHPNHFVVRAQTIETSSLPTDSDSIETEEKRILSY